MPDSHKQAALEFLKAAAAGKAREAGARYVAPDFKHHNPFFRGDATSLLDAMDQNARENPGKALEVHTAVEEGDRVAVFSEVHHKPGDRGAAVVHFFRFDGDRIAELWDVGQEVPEETVNEHGMF